MLVVLRRIMKGGKPGLCEEGRQDGPTSRRAETGFLFDVKAAAGWGRGSVKQSLRLVLQADKQQVG